MDETKKVLEELDEMLKHQAGRHNQKAHGVRHGSFSNVKASLRKLQDSPEELARYKKKVRAGITKTKNSPEAKKTALKAKGAKIVADTFAELEGKSTAKLMKEYGITKGEFKTILNKERNYFRPEVTEEASIQGYIKGKLALPMDKNYTGLDITHVNTGQAIGIPAPKTLNDGLKALIALDRLGNWDFGERLQDNSSENYLQGLYAISPVLSGARPVIFDNLKF